MTSLSPYVYCASADWASCWTAQLGSRQLLMVGTPSNVVSWWTHHSGQRLPPSVRPSVLWSTSRLCESQSGGRMFVSSRQRSRRLRNATKTSSVGRKIALRGRLTGANPQSVLSSTAVERRQHLRDCNCNLVSQNWRSLASLHWSLRK